MDAVEVSTTVYISPAEAYEFLIDFPRYADYSEYLDGVDQHGDGSPGTEYDLHFSWWKLTYTARSRVTAVDRPERIDWAVTKDIDAEGHWTVESVPEEAPEDRETASRVRLRIEFDPDSANPSGLDLPALVSLSTVIEKVIPLIESEAEEIVERIVADLEGDSRPVDLTVHTTPDSV